MLLLAAAWIVLLAVAVPTGLALLHLLRADRAFPRLADRVLAGGWLGLIALGVVLQAGSLFVALSPVTGAVVGVAFLAGTLSLPAVRSDLRGAYAAINAPLAAACAVLLVGVAAFVAQQVVWNDTGLYHAGTIRWLSEHGAVRGLAHLHSRFGYSSMWFDLTAPFNDGGLGRRMSAVLGGFGLLLASAQLALVATRTLAGRTRDWDLLALIGLGIALPIAVWWKQPISPNPDFPLLVLPVVVAWAIACVHGAGADAAAIARRPLLDARLIPLVLAAGAAAIKLSGAALILVAGLFYVWPPRLGAARVAVAAAAVGIVLAPALATGYVVSGCPLYPAGPCFDKRWAIAPEAAHDEAASIRSYARRRVAVPDERAASTDWIGSWVGRGQNVFLLATLVLGAVAAPRAPPAMRWALAAGFAGALLVLYSAPDLRFALGYSAVLAAAFGVSWAPWLRRRAPDAWARGVAPVAAATLVLVALGAGFLAARFVRSTVDGQRSLALVQPPRMTEPRLSRTATGNVWYFVPEGSLCWSAPLPCTSRSLIRSDTTLRDPEAGIGAGFAH